MKELALKKMRSIATTIVAESLAMPLLVGLVVSNIGCSTHSDGLVIPEPGSVPPPSMEPGETPDTGKLKRVKIG
jgi:hypothetical protein